MAGSMSLLNTAEYRYPDPEYSLPGRLKLYTRRYPSTVFARKLAAIRPALTAAPGVVCSAR